MFDAVTIMNVFIPVILRSFLEPRMHLSDAGAVAIGEMTLDSCFAECIFAGGGRGRARQKSKCEENEEMSLLLRCSKSSRLSWTVLGIA